MPKTVDEVKSIKITIIYCIELNSDQNKWNDEHTNKFNSYTEMSGGKWNSAKMKSDAENSIHKIH